MCLHIQVNSYTEPLLSPYGVTCMYVFKVGDLVLDNQLVCTPLGKPSLNQREEKIAQSTE